MHLPDGRPLSEFVTVNDSPTDRPAPRSIPAAAGVAHVEADVASVISSLGFRVRAQAYYPNRNAGVTYYPTRHP
jgi:hypothetical protein